MKNTRPYIIAVAASVPITVSIAVIWLMTGGDDTCRKDGCGGFDAVVLFGVALPYVLTAGLFVAALVRRRLRERLAMGVLALPILVLVLFMVALPLGLNPGVTIVHT